jgi:hypothetical protein
VELTTDRTLRESVTWKTLIREYERLDLLPRLLFPFMPRQKAAAIVAYSFTISGARESGTWSARACVKSVAMAISGHRTRAIFDRYNITSDDDLRQAIRQTSSHLAAQSAEHTIVSIRTK